MSSPDVIKVGLGQRLREVITAVGLSQRAVADEIGVSQAFLSKVGRELLPPSWPLLVGLSDRFNVSIDWLVTGSGAMFRPAPEVLTSSRAHPPEPDSLEDLVFRVRRLGPHDVELLEAYTRGFLAARERHPQMARAG